MEKDSIRRGFDLELTNWKREKADSEEFLGQNRARIALKVCASWTRIIRKI